MQKPWIYARKTPESVNAAVRVVETHLLKHMRAALQTKKLTQDELIEIRDEAVRIVNGALTPQLVYAAYLHSINTTSSAISDETRSALARIDAISHTAALQVAHRLGELRRIRRVVAADSGAANGKNEQPHMVGQRSRDVVYVPPTPEAFDAVRDMKALYGVETMPFRRYGGRPLGRIMHQRFMDPGDRYNRSTGDDAATSNKITRIAIPIYEHS